MREPQMYNEIIRAAWPFMWITRANVGTVKTDDGRRFTSGLPKGFSDLFGVLPARNAADGMEHTVFIECKAVNGKLSDAQRDFLNARYKDGCICMVVRSAGDFLNQIAPYVRKCDD